MKHILRQVDTQASPGIKIQLQQQSNNKKQE